MGTRTRLLVVDDKRLNRISLRMALGEEGYEVETANSVAVAYSMLDRYRYQVLITDLELPDGKGFEIIRYARNLNSSLKSILLTASDDPVDESEALMAGAGAIIHKPCRSSSIISATSEVLIRAGGSTSPGKERRFPLRGRSARRNTGRTTPRPDMNGWGIPAPCRRFAAVYRWPAPGRVPGRGM